MKTMIRSTARIALVAVVATALSAHAGEKKNKPRKVEDILEQIGGEHWNEDMKVSFVGSVPVGETFYHVFSGYVDPVYRIIIFDNKPEYLGYYESQYEPTGTEEEAVTFYVAGVTRKMTLGSGGPAKSTDVAGYNSKFVKAPEKPAPAQAAAAKPGTATGVAVEYREWNITLKGRDKPIPVRAIFIQKKGNKVTLKDEKRGVENDFELSTLSKEDLEYLKSIGQ